jgi:hypothetical protein
MLSGLQTLPSLVQAGSITALRAGGRAMDLYHYLRKEPRRREEVTQLWPSSWPNLSRLLTSLDKNITCLQINQVEDGHKAIIRFKNRYGLEIFKYLDSDFFEMVVIRFSGEAIDKYEFASHPAVSRFSLGYTEEDIFRTCAEVSRLS